MSKKPDMAAALALTKQAKEPQTPKPRSSIKKTTTISAPANTATAKPSSKREGQVHIGGWYDQNVKFSLEELRLKRQRETGQKIYNQDLLNEAFNELFKKYGFPEIAPTTKKG